MLLAAVDWLHYLFMIPLALISIFLILVILVQRGRGGGLTGALGGMGGASAFGTKAGDLFTKVTIAVAFVWIVLSMAALKILNQRTPFSSARGTGSSSAPVDPTGKTSGKGTSDKGSSDKGASPTTPPASGAKAATSKSSAPSAPASSPANSPPAE